jgi:hypothetical protein
MAKAKKTTTSAPKKKSAAAAPAGTPMIDTAQLAVAAAKFIGSKPAIAPTGGTPAKESASFKQLRESMNKPTGGSMADALNQTGGPTNKKSNAPHFGGKQVGRNQTFGADVNRTGVPRRTGG